MKALEVLLGYGCNEKCLFCSQELAWRRQEGLPFEQVARQLYLAAKDGYRSVCFTGGEPTLRRDLATMVALAHRLGYAYIRIQTNGVRLCDPALARELLDAGANFFRVSIHGHTPELHDGLVGLPGALERVWRGIENVRGRAGVGVNVVLNARNVRELPALCAALLDRGLSRFVLIFPLYEGDMAVHEAEMRLSMADAAPFVREAFEVFRSRQAEPPHLLNFTPCALPELAPYMLSWSAWSALVVDARGRPVDLYMASHDDRAKPDYCRRCVYDADCLGFKTSYLERFPEGASGPVARRPAEARGASRASPRLRILQDGGGLFGGSRVEIARAVQPVPGAGPGKDLRVEQMRIHLDPASRRIEEERTQWTAA